jgi:protocatechuate 3,4-dioxygenase beta subunit
MNGRPSRSRAFSHLSRFTSRTNRAIRFQPTLESLADRVVPAAISGSVYLDSTGNGLSPDDTGLGGAVVRLYRDTNNTGAYDGGDALVATRTSASSGAYSFTGLRTGRYFVVQSAPGGFVRTGPAASPYLTVNLTRSSQSVGGRNFDNFKLLDTSAVTNISYQVTHTNPDGSTTTGTVTDLRGNTRQGDTVTASFTVAAGKTATVSLVAYNAPGASFDANTAGKQTIVQNASGTFGPGQHSLTVTIPNNHYQIDFVAGLAIDHFGPAGGNVFYSAQHRLYSADNQGTNPVGTGTLSGRVALDVNQNGVLTDAGDVGLAGVTVSLYRANGAFVASRLTDGNGNYTFTGVAPGSYTLRQGATPGYDDGRDYVGQVNGRAEGRLDGDDAISNITLAAGQGGAGYNFTEKLQTGVISGRVILDGNQNGSFDDAGDRPLAGLTITLLDTAGNVALDADGNALTTTTGTDGLYSFARVLPGTYTIRQTQPAEFADGADYPGSAGGTANALGAANDISGVTIAGGQVSVNNTFTERGGAINGRVFLDVNQDGALNGAGDLALAGVTVTLTDAAGNVVATALTDTDGAYSFTGLAAGAYRVAASQPEEYADGLDYLDGIAVGTSDDTAVSLAAGATVIAEFTERLNQPIGVISGRVFVDVRQDGTRDAADGDRALGGVLVHLFDADGNFVASTLTDGGGNYRFEGLADGTYTVFEEQPNAFADGFDYAAGIRVDGSDAGDSLIATVTGGAESSGNDFTERAGASSVSGWVVLPSEGRNPPGISGVTVTLSYTNEAGHEVAFTTTTDQDGNFWFTGLAAGTYTLTEVVPDGYTIPEPAVANILLSAASDEFFVFENFPI